MVNVTTEVHDDVVILHIIGEFYLESVEYVDSIWKEQIQNNPRVIGINCSRIAFIDSSGIGAFVKFLNISVKMNIELVFFELSKTFAYLFKTARLNKFFKTMTKQEFDKTYL